MTAMAATAVEAEKVSIVLWKEAPAQRAGLGSEQLGLPLSPVESGLHALPVQIDGLTIGEVLIHWPKAVTPGNSRLLAIVALFIGKSIQVAQLPFCVSKPALVCNDEL